MGVFLKPAVALRVKVVCLRTKMKCRMCRIEAARRDSRGGKINEITIIRKGDDLHERVS